MRRVDQDQLVVFVGQGNLLLEDHQLVAGVLVEPDLTHTQYVRLVEELGMMAITSRARPVSSASLG